MSANTIVQETLTDFRACALEEELWTRRKSSIPVAEHWLTLLSQATGDAVAAQGYGFDHLHTKDDIIAAEAILRRFVNIFGGTN